MMDDFTGYGTHFTDHINIRVVYTHVTMGRKACVWKIINLRYTLWYFADISVIHVHSFNKIMMKFPSVPLYSFTFPPHEIPKPL